MLGRFRKSKEPAPKMVPGNVTAMIFDACGMRPEPGARMWLSGFPDDCPEWITQAEDAKRLAALPSVQETMSELLRDPDVRTVVEAFVGEAAILELEN